MAEKQDPNQPILGVPNPYPPNYNGITNPVTAGPASGYQHVQHTTISQVVQQQMESPAVENIPCEEHLETEYIYKLTPHVEIAFEDTFKESKTAEGISFMKDVNGAIYKYTHFAVYASLALIVAPFMTFLWAFVFAVSHLLLVWFIQPMIKNTFLWFRICSMLMTASVRLFFDPIFKSASLMLSGIKGRFQMNDTDITLNVKSSPIQEV